MPVSAFNSSSTAEDVTRGLDLTGKTAMVTGATSGLGLETLRVLALRGAHVVATGRTRERAVEACSSMAAGRSTPVAMDLENWDSVVAAAGTIAALGRPLDILICNAGIMAPPALRLVNGVEQQFAVNHLGHFVLCHHLLGPLRAANQGRVVVVSSWLYSMAPPSGIDFENLDGSRGYDPQQASRPVEARQRPLCLRACRAAVRQSGHGQRAAPGGEQHQPRSVQSRVAASGRPSDRRNRPWVKSVEEAAATQAYLATAPGLATVTGQYFEDCNPVIPTGRHVRDRELAARLWAKSEELTRRYLP